MDPKTLKLLNVSTTYPSLEGIFFIAYRHAVRVGYQEKISRYLYDFRESREPQTSRWITLASELVGQELPINAVVRALGSGELAGGGMSPLDRLCEAIAKACGAKYLADAVHKLRVVKPVSSLGGKQARKTELSGVYSFSNPGLPSGSRILVVDDFMTTGATLEAVASAVAASVEQAEVFGFVLAHTEGLMANSHLDPAYFTAPLPAKAHVEEEAVVIEEVAVENPASVVAAPASASEETIVVDSVNEPIHEEPVEPPEPPAAPPRRQVHFTPNRPPVRSVKTSRAPMAQHFPDVGRVARKMGLQGALLIVLAGLLVFGAIVMLQPNKAVEPHLTLPEPPIAPPVNQQAEASLPPVPAAAEESSFDPDGVIAVPTVGLRRDHSFTARTIGKLTLRAGDRVEILRRFYPDSGPSWMQIRTRGGRTGWVFASVVKETAKGRRR